MNVQHNICRRVSEREMKRNKYLWEIQLLNDGGDACGWLQEVIECVEQTNCETLQSN